MDRFCLAMEKKYKKLHTTVLPGCFFHAIESCTKDCQYCNLQIGSEWQTKFLLACA